MAINSVISFNVAPMLLSLKSASCISRISMSDPVEPFPTTSTKLPQKKARIPAKWFPFGGVKAPLILDGSLPGDVGFDPLGFAKTSKTLYWMRDAEIKHGRLAMLAAVGWPISELWHKNIAVAFGLDSILAKGDKAPSILNGGLSNVWATGILIMSIIFAGYLEGKAMNDGNIFWGAQKPKDYIPGNYNFDPLNLLKSRGNKDSMILAEVKNGELQFLFVCLILC